MSWCTMTTTHNAEVRVVTSTQATPSRAAFPSVSVEIYAALPPHGEADIIHVALPAGATILELGCGTGRIADPLVALRHRVTDVDSSRAMLSCLRSAEPVHSTFEAFAPDERFDGVEHDPISQTPDLRR